MPSDEHLALFDLDAAAALKEKQLRALEEAEHRKQMQLQQAAALHCMVTVTPAVGHAAASGQHTKNGAAS